MKITTLERPTQMRSGRMFYPEAILSIIETNIQRVALQQHLIHPGETFSLTCDQQKAIESILTLRQEGVENILIKAPTGSGKTEVEFRVAIQEYLKHHKPVITLVPTRDLSRQHYQYYVDRIKGTPLFVAEFHGGFSRGYRQGLMEKIKNGQLHFLIASTLILQRDDYLDLLKSAGLMIIDDVNAFDEEDHLSILAGIDTPMLFASATPQQVYEFLDRKNAFSNLIEMKAMPFNAPPTQVHHIRGNLEEDVLEQVNRALKYMERHLQDQGRIFVISRTRANVPRIAEVLEARLEVPVASLHGEMVDTQFQANRMRRFGQEVPRETRIAMMKRFKDSLPSVLVATNLVGSGIDIPHADLIVITDADSFGEHELEQLIGRVGRRNRSSEAVLITQTIRGKRLKKPRSIRRRGSSATVSSARRNRSKNQDKRESLLSHIAVSHNGSVRSRPSKGLCKTNAPKGIPGWRLSDVL